MLGIPKIVTYEVVGLVTALAVMYARWGGMFTETGAIVSNCTWIFLWGTALGVGIYAFLQYRGNPMVKWVVSIGGIGAFVVMSVLLMGWIPIG